MILHVSFDNIKFLVVLISTYSVFLLLENRIGGGSGMDIRSKGRVIIFSYFTQISLLIVFGNVSLFNRHYQDQ